MLNYNVLENLHEIDDAQIQHVVDSLNRNYIITDSEEPFLTYYLILKNWKAECTKYLINKGYQGQTLAVKRDFMEKEDPTSYALYNPDKLNAQDIKVYLENIAKSK